MAGPAPRKADHLSAPQTPAGARKKNTRAMDPPGTPANSAEHVTSFWRHEGKKHERSKSMPVPPMAGRGASRPRPSPQKPRRKVQSSPPRRRASSPPRTHPHQAIMKSPIRQIPSRTAQRIRGTSLEEFAGDIAVDAPSLPTGAPNLGMETALNMFFRSTSTTEDVVAEETTLDILAEKNVQVHDLMVENEMLREQVQTLKQTVTQLESERTSMQLSSLEDDLMGMSVQSGQTNVTSDRALRRRKRWSERETMSTSIGELSFDLGELDTAPTLVKMKGGDDDSVVSGLEMASSPVRRPKGTFRRQSEVTTEVERLKQELAAAHNTIKLLRFQLGNEESGKASEASFLSS